MKYLLDTNACIHLINGRVPRIRTRFLSILRIDMGVSIITKAELYYGSAKSQTPERTRAKQQEFLNTIETVPFDETAALHFGDIRAALERAGKPIGAYDMLIAATALANALILVTHNVDEMSRVGGLHIDDWEV